MYSINCASAHWEENLQAEIRSQFFLFASFYDKPANGDLERMSIDTSELILSLILSNSIELKTEVAGVQKREISLVLGKRMTELCVSPSLRRSYKTRVVLSNDSTFEAYLILR
jgi:hypothetical protein